MKKKPFYSRKIFRKILKYIALGICTSLVTMTIILYSQNPDVFERLSNLIPSSSSMNTKLDKSNPSVNVLKTMIKTMFNNYFSICKNFDEIYTNRRKCINSYGIKASLLESISTLYLLGLKEEYNQVLQFLKTSYDVSTLKWVNVHEYWTRGVGSLIESYLITNNKLFKNLAIKMADQMLKYQESEYQQCYMFDLQNGNCKKKAWLNGTSISNIVAGLPELLALYEITKDKKYVEAADSIFGKIPIQDIQLHSSYGEDGSGVGPLDLDGYKVSFLYNIALALTLRDNSEITSYLMECVSFFPSELNTDYYDAFPLLDVVKYFAFADIPVILPPEESLASKVIDAYIDPEYPAFSLSGKLSGTTGFNFESAGLRELARTSVTDHESLKRFIKIITEGLTRTKSQKSHSSIRKSSIGKASLSNYQPSNVFGQWTNIGALAASGNLKYVNMSAFNERGHIIRLKIPQRVHKE
ncbi:hypothetical protein TVAG_117390 [Trichomonas vaginalis G3]|uniref:Alpha-1,2-Mannosidase n=1 Tax=Trichomonas vaginalis (strain ATCC PRA-98 / G3) TaxID=412133 RepID=A2E3S9_TRIV3|nr:mannosyl-oligosaccharide 1,2-alpha-mannosidase protein [Trichomonas vaginalis G3]EAY12717.1 hypothetical protein TVAG_117390 [Trichomonas vaginalis G3]KAI5517521.1 mannosyl-oligosaccharide 1,2-alpha-mannosidase protein [Trichomonas vaginalis G3]|eukprot:XP_001324940.1 hypothetical protein [Trichomonas vaginalis G3]